MTIAKDKLTSVSDPRNDIIGMIGEFVDLETIVAYRDLMHRLNCENLDVRSNAAHFKTDFRN